MAALTLGPLLRHVGEHDATVWVETDVACEVDVLGARAPTFAVEGHHYALVVITDLERGGRHPYEVALDGERVWPEPDSPFPPSTIVTLDPGRPADVLFGSCRVSRPHGPPDTLAADEHRDGMGVDALRAFALRLHERWPDQELPEALLLLGDQIYADEVSPHVLEFIKSRRDIKKPPGEEVADFEEYTRLYWDAWRDPAIRWLLSTVPTAMIFDDHDVHDDWNTSKDWVEKMRSKPWWRKRIVGAFMSYWLYQHLGNLSPRELEHDELFQRVAAAGDATEQLRAFAQRADDGHEGLRWSYCRDLGSARLVVMDSRAGRVLEPGARMIMDEEEWQWIEEQVRGEFDHLLLATTLPLLLAPGMHHLEAWSEAVCNGAWGRGPAKAVEVVRQAVDLEHWPAFADSFERVTRLIAELGAGRFGTPPASIVVLSGDVHHAYLAEVAFRPDAAVKSAVYQATCSPVRNPLGRAERAFMKTAASGPAEAIGRALARAAGVEPPSIRWRFVQAPSFDNQIATMTMQGRDSELRIECAVPGDDGQPMLKTSLHRELSRSSQLTRVPAHITTRT